MFIARGGKEDLLATANLNPGESVYGEKRVTVENTVKNDDGTPATKSEYRVWVCTFAMVYYDGRRLTLDLTESLPIQACCWHPRRSRQHLYEAWFKGESNVVRL